MKSLLEFLKETFNKEIAINRKFLGTPVHNDTTWRISLEKKKEESSKSI